MTASPPDSNLRLNPASRGLSCAAEGGAEAGDLIDRVMARGVTLPGAAALTFLGSDGVTAATMDNAALAARVAALGGALAARRLGGRRVLLLHPQGPEFAQDFLGVLAAGAVAVPAPHSLGRKAGAERIRAIAADADPAIVLTTDSRRDMAEAALAGGVPVWTADELIAETAPAPLPVRRGTDVALLQYTSGSTGTPKGTMISLAAMTANAEQIRRLFRHGPGSVMVSWLPMFHDMGLVGGLLQPLHVGFHGVLMTPDSFLEDPRRWLDAIGRFGGTTAGAPNFAYDYCVDRIPPEAREGIDLGRWAVAFNGSEPVRAATMDRFATAFAGQGFRAEAFFPCYGMAETTLLATCGTPGRPARRIAPMGGAPIVSCGRPGPGHEIAVVDPTTGQPCADGQEGEIWLRGPSLALGYWGKPGDPAFGARLDGRGEGWMRTGDLGLIDTGEIFVTGRIKDVIIVRGRNHHPQDLESSAAAAHPALRRDGGAAVLVEGAGRDRIVLIHEVTSAALRAPPVKDIAAAVRAALATEHGLHLAIVALIAPGRLPRTTSGKVRRAAARDAYLDGTLVLLAEDRHGPALRRPATPDPGPAPRAGTATRSPEVT
jgi:acyl-CoA synthetase (AMP-forming)/AMP-acid ligase II